MDKFSVVQSTKSLNDIDSIFFYISEVLENINSAISIFYKIKARIDSLELFPAEAKTRRSRLRDPGGKNPANGRHDGR